MPAVINQAQAKNRRLMTARRLYIGDGVTLTKPDGAAANYRRVDGIFVLYPQAVEIAGLVEDAHNSEFGCWIKNTTGSTLTVGQLLANSTTMTAAGSATAAANVSAGTNIVVPLTVTGTIEVGSMCQFVDAASPNPVQNATCTVASGGNYTFDVIPYDMTTPTITVLPARCPILATNASGGETSWVVTSSILNNAYGIVWGAARVTGIDTSAYTQVGSKAYLGTGGAATPTIPTTSTTTGQYVGKVLVKSASVGEMDFFPYRRIIEKLSSSGLQSGLTLPTGAAGTVLEGGASPAFTPNIVLGTAGSVVGSVNLANTTSGSVTIAPPTGALGTPTFSTPPSTTSQNLVGDTATQTLTNKTLTAPVMTTPVLGTPTSGNLSNCTNYPTANLTGAGTGVLTFLATATSANLAAALTDETGSGVAVFGTTPTLATPVINGLATGTGVASAATASTLATRDANANLTTNNLIESYATTATATATTTLTVGSAGQQFFTGSTTQTVVLPVVSTLVLGQQFLIVNNSTGIVTVNSSGANLVQSMVGNSMLWVTVILTTGTTAASWAVEYVPNVTPEIKGGTNQSSYTTGDILGASATNTLSKIAAVVAGKVLLSAGTGTLPLWGNVAGWNLQSGSTYAPTTAVDNNKVVYMSNGLGATFTLPAPATVGSGYVVTVMKGSASTVNVVVARNGSETIDGNAASSGLKDLESYQTLITDGTNWFTLASRDYVANTATSVAAGSSGSTANVTSIVLPPGEWDINATIAALNGTLQTSLSMGITTTSATITGTLGLDWLQSPTQATTSTEAMPSYRMLITASTTVYVTGTVTYTGTGVTLNGRLSARRIR